MFTRTRREPEFLHPRLHVVAQPLGPLGRATAALVSRPAAGCSRRRHARRRTAAGPARTTPRCRRLRSPADLARSSICPPPHPPRAPMSRSAEPRPRPPQRPSDVRCQSAPPRPLALPAAARRQPGALAAWGDAALAEARARGVPILLSVGYAACHWCHVMAHESFEDADTAALMNRLFVNIKVDREERPDIDHIYMSALHALGEQGGWPLTMFLTPDGKPFWGGTYFPPEPRWGRPSFRQVLQGVARAFAAGDGAVAQNVDGAARGAGAASPRPARAPMPGPGRRSTPSPPACSPASIRCMAACVARRASPTRRCSASSGSNARRTGDPAGARGGARPAARRCRWAASTTISAAALPAIRPTPNGSCRISRRCSTTTRRSSTCWRSPTPRRPDPALRGARRGDWSAGSTREMTTRPTRRPPRLRRRPGRRQRGRGRPLLRLDRGRDRRACSARRGAAFKAAYDVRPDGNWEGRTVLRRLAPPGTPEEEAARGEPRACCSRPARQPHPARPRRQGAGRLERP